MSDSLITEPQIHIEPMRADDPRAIIELERRAGLTAWGEESYLRDLQNPSAILLVARRSDQSSVRQLAGFLAAWVVADEFQLHNMAVTPDFRRQGIGAALLAEALRLARRKGATSGVLEVRAANTAAQALYQSFGFHAVGRRKNYYHHPPDDALLMICDLQTTATGDE